MAKPDEDAVGIGPSAAGLRDFVSSRELRLEERPESGMQLGERRRGSGRTPLFAREFIDSERLVRTLEKRIVVRSDADQLETALLEHTPRCRVGFQRAG